MHRWAYRGDLWKAGSIINADQGSSDGFIYFRSWLIGQGRVVYERALDDPEMLAEVGVPFQEAECEKLMYAAWEAYAEKTGEVETMYEAWSDPVEPIGVYWGSEDPKRHFPRLCAMYEWEPIKHEDWRS